MNLTTKLWESLKAFQGAHTERSRCGVSIISRACSFGKETLNDLYETVLYRRTICYMLYVYAYTYILYMYVMYILYIYILYIHTYIHTCIHTYTHTHIHVCVCERESGYVHVNTCYINTDIHDISYLHVSLHRNTDTPVFMDI
jgi:hypothetical protein